MFALKRAQKVHLWSKLKTLILLLLTVFLFIILLFHTLSINADFKNNQTQGVGSNFFTDSGQALGNSPSWDVALGDLDGDKDLDAIVANGKGSVNDDPNTIWFNNGQGIFSSTSGIGDFDSWAIALGDFDGDTDLDAFVGQNYSQDSVWFNDGNGFFTNTGQLLSNGNTWSIAIGNIDNDTDLDAITIDRSGVGNQVWLNNGSGFFTSSEQPLGSGDNSQHVVLADLDSDTDLDVFIAVGTLAGGTGENQVWFNDGSGTFTNTMQALGALNSTGVAIADLDDDDDVDAFVVNQGQANKVWLNNGKGFFTDSMQSLGNNDSMGVVLSDVDYDGDNDAIVTNRNQDTQIWLNDGTGVFTASQQLSTSGYQGVALGDLNQDNLSDLYFANGGTCDFVCLGAVNKVFMGNEAAIVELTATNNSPNLLFTSTTLTATVKAGSNITYTWNLGNNIIITGKTVEYNYLIPGVYTPIVTATNSLNSLTATTTVTITGQNVYLPAIAKP